jgi:Transcriptional regulator, AbiEi antitoxin/Protein of unknown function (DUF559)
MDEDLPASIARLALRQQGNVTRRQLLKLGLGASAITYRVRKGRLYRVHPGVYSVGRPPQSPLERAAAAVLARGPGAALSHLSALALWGFAKHLSAPFDVAVQTDRRPKGIQVHLLGPLQEPRPARPEAQQRVNGYEVDAYFDAHKLIVEVDGWGLHRTKQAFEADRIRDVEALANGLTTVRITYDRLTNDPATEVARLKRILSRASAPPGPSEKSRPSPRGSTASPAAPPPRRSATDRPAR